jgi:hypothetical protein
MFQFPGQQGEVAVVMKGVEGCGKGTLAKVLMNLIGQHSLAISNAKHLVGNFNAHLRETVFLFADEAFYAGDKAHVGALKSLITESTLAIEAKYANVTLVKNHIHLMMASNEAWVIPASLDARRFLMLLVSDTRKGDFAYFEAIWQQMENGGYEAMVYDMLTMDLSGFKVRAVPHTAGLGEQQKLSGATHERWFMDVLHRGYVFTSKLGNEHFFQQWFTKVATQLMFKSYVDFAHTSRDILSQEAFGEFIANVGGTHCRLRVAPVGEAHDKIPHPARSWGYVLGTLDEARRKFAAATGLTIAWPQNADELDADEPEM